MEEKTAKDPQNTEDSGEQNNEFAETQNLEIRQEMERNDNIQVGFERQKSSIH